MSSSTMLTESTDRFGYDPITETYHAQCKWVGPDELCLSIVDAVATATDQEPREMEPLFAALDPDPLQELLNSAGDDDIQVSFTYEECAIVVASSGDLVVQPMG